MIPDVDFLTFRVCQEEIMIQLVSVKHVLLPPLCQILTILHVYCQQNILGNLACNTDQGYFSTVGCSSFLVFFFLLLN